MSSCTIMYNVWGDQALNIQTSRSIQIIQSSLFICYHMGKKMTEQIITELKNIDGMIFKCKFYSI